MTLKSIEAEVEKEFEGVLDKWQNGGLTFTAKAWLRTQLRRVALEVVREVTDGSFEHLDRVKKAWEGIEKDGNPNEQVQAQIFGFNQCYEIAAEARQAMQERADALIGKNNEI